MGCGRAVVEADRAALHAVGAVEEVVDAETEERGKKVREGAKWIGALAILFAISGFLMFALQQVETNKALEHLQQFQDEDVLQPIDGKVYTAGELRVAVEREPYQVLMVNLLVAGLMTALWVWAKRAPLPAIACAFALFLVVHLVSAMIDPTSIPKGMIIKILAIVALGKGLKAALEARAMTRRPAA
ncbi:hypothetical protein NR798_11435 [Archangium gephyra]|uniref:hypothetical protein n=1 Tax=Archangium gephyra TaxID=48 RepID=UPI0035D4922C